MQDLTGALFGKTRKSLLALFFTSPEESFYVRQVARLIQAGMGATQRELKSLSKEGILKRWTRGRQVYYQANPESPIFDELKSLMTKTAGLRDHIVSALSPISDRITVSFIFGSFAEGTSSGWSDVDLMVVGDVSSEEVVSLLQSPQLTLGREINPVIYPVTEFREKAAGKAHFIFRVLSGPKIFVIGDENELARLVE